MFVGEVRALVVYAVAGWGFVNCGFHFLYRVLAPMLVAFIGQVRALMTYAVAGWWLSRETRLVYQVQVHTPVLVVFTE